MALLGEIRRKYERVWLADKILSIYSYIRAFWRFDDGGADPLRYLVVRG